MNRYSSLFPLLLAGLFLIGAVDASAQKKMGEKPVLWSADDIKWVQLAGAPPGVMSATLWGDQTKGAYAGLTKFPAGFKAPLHHHSYTTKIVVIKGAYTYNGTHYGPGSFVLVPGGVAHESGGLDDAESIFFIEQAGKFDLVPEKTPDMK
jgi:quercetin dioxygenase-like cupin family protein